MKRSLLYTENNWQYLLPMITLPFKWKLKFWKICINNVELDSFLKKDFSDKISYIKKNYKHTIIRCQYSRKNCISNEPSIFQMTKACLLKIMQMSKIHYLQCKTDQMDFNVAENKADNKVQISHYNRSLRSYTSEVLIMYQRGISIIIWRY